MIRSFVNWLRRGPIADRGGTVMVEFAIILPILMFVMLAGVDLVRFAMLQQKLNRAAVTMADLVSQYAVITTTHKDQIFLAMEHVIAPFPMGASGRVIISSISRVDAGNPVLVTWQRAGGGSATATSNFGTTGSTATLPAGFTVLAGQNVIVAEVFYDFEPLLFEAVLPSRRVEHNSFFRPRFGSLEALGP